MNPITKHQKNGTLEYHQDGIIKKSYQDNVIVISEYNLEGVKLKETFQYKTTPLGIETTHKQVFKWNIYSCLIEKSEYKNDQLHGEQIFYLSEITFTGTERLIEKISNYRHGKLNGTQTEYQYQDLMRRLINTKTTQYKDGLKHGEEIQINQEGEIYEKITYKNGIRHGKAYSEEYKEHYYEDGVIVSINSTYNIITRSSYKRNKQFKS